MFKMMSLTITDFEANRYLRSLVSSPQDDSGSYIGILVIKNGRT